MKFEMITFSPGDKLPADHLNAMQEVLSALTEGQQGQLGNGASIAFAQGVDGITATVTNADGSTTVYKIALDATTGQPTSISVGDIKCDIAWDGFESLDEVIKNLTETAETALSIAQEAKENAGISREFNKKSDTGEMSMTHTANAAWFYIVEIMDSTLISSVASRYTMALDYFSLVSGNTYEFPNGVTIQGYVNDDKGVTVMILDDKETGYRISRFTGYL